MRMNKRMLFGCVSIALAAVVALVGIPAVTSQSSAKVKIVRAVAGIEKGTVITEEQVELVEIGSHGLAEGTITDTGQVVGLYALCDFVPGDAFLPAKVSPTSPETDTILTKLSGDKMAVSLSVNSLAGSLSNKLRADDIVTIYSYENGVVVQPEELRYVRIIAVTNADGINLDDAIGEDSRMAATVTFLVDTQQAETMVDIENAARLHLALVSRGDIDHAKELLAEQEQVLTELALEAETAAIETEEGAA